MVRILTLACVAFLFPWPATGQDRGEPMERTQREERPNRAARKVEVKDPSEFANGREVDVFSGPQRGESVPAFSVRGLFGSNEGKDIDPASEADGKSQLLFLQDDNGVAIRGVLAIVELRNKIAQKIDKAPHLACVFLTDDPQGLQRRYANAFAVMNDRGMDTIAVSNDGRDGPGVLGLDRNMAQTIVLIKDGKVVRNFVFPQGMLYPDPQVLGGIAELIDVDRETVQAWMNEAPTEQPAMRRDDSRPGKRQSATPQAELRKRLSALVDAGKLTRDEAAELYSAAFPDEQPTADEK